MYWKEWKKSKYKRKLIVKKRNGGKTEVLGGNYQYWNHKKMQNGMKKSEQMEKKVFTLIRFYMSGHSILVGKAILFYNYLSSSHD